MYKQYIDSVPEPRQRNPVVIQFPINDICNSKCQMCHIWKQKKAHEITPDEVRKILVNPLYKDVVSVGINGGEPTLRRDIGQIAMAAAETLPSLTSISLITNAIKYEQVISAIDKVGAVCDEKGISLDVMVSLDGVGDVHDRVRGVEGNFESAEKVIDFILDNPLVTATRVGCTIIRENVYDIENVLRWCEEKGIYARFRLGIPHQRLYTREISEPFNLNYEEKYHVANFLDYLYHCYEKKEATRAFYRSLRDQIIYSLPRRAGCTWKNKGVTLTSSGELAYCAVESRILGSALSEDSERLYWENAGHLAEINKNRCAGCMHDYDGISDRRVFAASVARRVLDRTPDQMNRLLKDAVRKGMIHREKGRIRKAFESLRTRSVDQPVLKDRVLICGWYGTETLGDKAILGGIVNVIGNIPGRHPVDIASIEPYVTQMTARQMPELNIERILDLEHAKKAVKDGDYRCVIIGGGPLTSFIRATTDLLELFASARRVGAKTMIAGCGIGPLDVAWRNKTIAMLLESSDVTVLRDESSIKLARAKLGYKGESSSMLDPAFLWIRENMPKEMERDDNQVLLALRDWQVHEYASAMPREKALSIKQNFEEELIRFVDEIIRINPDVRIIPFCMHKHAVGGDDRFFYQRVFSRYPGIIANLDRRYRSPREDLKLICRSRAILAMRFHGVVFSLATKTPFIAVDYTMGGKTAGLLRDLDVEDSMISIEDFNGREAARRLLEADIDFSMVDNKVKRSEQILSQSLSRLIV